MGRRGGWPILAAMLLTSAPAMAAACRADRASFAVGKTFTDALADAARERSGATVVRRMVRSSAYTMEFRDDRLNLRVDQKGLVFEVHCG